MTKRLEDWACDDGVGLRRSCRETRSDSYSLAASSCTVSQPYRFGQCPNCTLSHSNTMSLVQSTCANGAQWRKAAQGVSYMQHNTPLQGAMWQNAFAGAIWHDTFAGGAIGQHAIVGGYAMTHRLQERQIADRRISICWSAVMQID